MNIREALEKLGSYQEQIIHGGTPFKDIADAIRDLEAESASLKARLLKLANASSVLWDEHKQYALNNSDSEGHKMMQVIVDETNISDATLGQLITMEKIIECWVSRAEKLETEAERIYGNGSSAHASTLRAQAEEIKTCVTEMKSITNI